MSELNETCEGCRFWDANGPASTFRDEGKCRRYAPVREHWPETMRDDWCGEFEPIEEARPDETLDPEGEAALRHVHEAEDGAL